jgi:PAS domain S-box-containing protein
MGHASCEQLHLTHLLMHPMIDRAAKRNDTMRQIDASSLLIELQKRTGLTQAALAAALRVSLPTVNRWINRKTRPDTRALDDIRAYIFGLGTAYGDLIERFFGKMALTTNAPTVEGVEPGLAAGEQTYRARAHPVPIGHARADGISGLEAWRLAPRADGGEAHERGHLVQFYDGDAFLVEAVSRFLGVGLDAGDGAVVVATKPHLDGIEERLRARGLDIATAREQGRYVALDAAETLSRFMADGWPEKRRFAEVLGGVIAGVADGRPRPVRVFGEMVALLWAQGNQKAAVRLEELWNGLARSHAFSLLCAYPMRSFRTAADGATFLEVCGEHSRVLPAETYAALPSPEERLRVVTQLQQKANALEAEVARRRQAEHALEQMIDLLPAGVYACEAPSGVITRYNRRAAELWGREPKPGDPAERFCGSFRLFRPDGAYMAHGDTPMADVLRGGPPVRNQEVIIERPDGSRVTVLVNIAPITDAQATVVGAVNVFQDISGEKQARAARRQLAAIVECSDDAIIGKTLDGVIESWNAGAQRIYGYTAAEILGRPVSVLVPPDRSDEVPRILARLRRGERIDHYETERVRKDGARIEVSLTVSPIRDETGRITGASAVARDITERRRAEQEREQLLAREQAARAEAERAARARDHFLARASHELRTPLTSALGTIRLVERALAGMLQESPEELIAIARRNISATLALINDLLDASKLSAQGEPLALEPVEVAAAAAAAFDLVATQAREKGVRVTSAVPEGLVVRAEAARLEQVLVNLLANAVKFTPAGGEVTVEAAGEGPDVVIRVRDTGEGIGAEHLERIFEPFFQAPGAVPRSKAVRRGTGLGLAICRQIVTLHGGRIWAESDGPGRGSTFAIRLPADIADGRAA